MALEKDEMTFGPENTEGASDNDEVETQQPQPVQRSVIVTSKKKGDRPTAKLSKFVTESH